MRRIKPIIATNGGILLSFNSIDVPVAMIRRNPKIASGIDALNRNEVDDDSIFQPLFNRY